MTEHEAYVAFNMLPGVGAVKVASLVKRHLSAVAAWESFSDKTGWDGKPVDWAAEIALAKKKNVVIVDCTDSRYPQSLADLPSRPLVLYVTGNPDALSMPGVAIVGTRLPTLYGTDMAQSFAYGIARAGMSIISGLATGIDAYAHTGALAAGGVTVGVLGGALDKFFPEENRELARKIVASGGAVVSEYPFGFPPGKKTFPQRNRIVAALSRGVLAVECPVQSGTHITCDWAKKLGRKLMAVPGNLDSKQSAGCWKLIREGALMVTSAKEAAEAAGAKSAAGVRPTPARQKGASVMERTSSRPVEDIHVESSVAPKTTLEEASVLKAIPSAGITLERLAFVTKLPAGNIADATMSLRLKGLLRFLPGNRVALTPPIP